ncbi:hypothetical protein FGO68_gene12151 [Halteria grandinella]|uniref:Uncharacterized protein n=1 Tax=Halteria grandinella TaxID=5974 RepID=A0A8J8NK94_HALGN|nr:hypothetical protein FGO68_gene12151 [Halteria grandinella]
MVLEHAQLGGFKFYPGVKKLLKCSLVWGGCDSQWLSNLIGGKGVRRQHILQVLRSNQQVEQDWVSLVEELFWIKSLMTQVYFRQA